MTPLDLARQWMDKGDERLFLTWRSLRALQWRSATPVLPPGD